MAAPEHIVALVHAERPDLCETHSDTETLLEAVWPAIEQHIREQVASEIEQAAEASANSTIDRPRYERGGFLNDSQWAAQIARGTETTRSTR